MKLFTIYKNPKYTNLCVHTEEFDVSSKHELKQIKNEIIDELTQKFMPAFVVEESEVDNLIKQLKDVR